jgi:hypothetical protein
LSEVSNSVPKVRYKSSVLGRANAHINFREDDSEQGLYHIAALCSTLAGDQSVKRPASPVDIQSLKTASENDIGSTCTGTEYGTT